MAAFRKSRWATVGQADAPEGTRWLTVAEAADRLKVSKATIYKLVTSRFLPHVRVGNSIRIAEAALERPAEVVAPSEEPAVALVAERSAPLLSPAAVTESALDALAELVTFL